MVSMICIWRKWQTEYIFTRRSLYKAQRVILSLQRALSNCFLSVGSSWYRRYGQQHASIEWTKLLETMTPYSFHSNWRNWITKRKERGGEENKKKSKKGKLTFITDIKNLLYVRYIPDDYINYLTYSYLVR